MKSTIVSPLATLLGLALWVGVAHAAPSLSITTSPGTEYTTSEVFGFKTTGADMVDMTVKVCDSSGCESRAWEKTGTESGAAVGTDWSLSLDGDSFDPNKAFVLKTTRAITGFSMDGRSGQTTFDIVTNPEASLGSQLGRPFTFIESQPDIEKINVRYVDALAVKEIFYDDLYLVMEVDFGGASFTGQLLFQTDTDNTGVITRLRPTPAPEPATLVLVAGALLGLAAARPKRARRA